MESRASWHSENLFAEGRVAIVKQATASGPLMLTMSQHYQLEKLQDPN